MGLNSMTKKIDEMKKKAYRPADVWDYGHSYGYGGHDSSSSSLLVSGAEDDEDEEEGDEALDDCPLPRLHGVVQVQGLDGRAQVCGECTKMEDVCINNEMKSTLYEHTHLCKKCKKITNWNCTEISNCIAFILTVLWCTKLYQVHFFYKNITRRTINYKGNINNKFSNVCINNVLKSAV